VFTVNGPKVFGVHHPLMFVSFDSLILTVVYACVSFTKVTVLAPYIDDDI
jgi:hypothetical protein